MPLVRISLMKGKPEEKKKIGLSGMALRSMRNSKLFN